MKLDEIEEEVKRLSQESEELKRRIDRFLAKEYLFYYELDGKMNPKKRRKELAKYF